MKQSPAARTRSESPAATGLSRSSLPRPRRTVSRSSASRPAPGTTSRDLGLDPRDPAGALRAFSHGVEKRRIDLGEVNGRLFLNNVSLGVYGDAVQEPVYRDAKVRTLLETGRSRHRASGKATGSDSPTIRGHEYMDCALVLVSNNPYALDPRPRRGGRSSLEGGRLGVIAVEGPSGGRGHLARAWTTTHLEVQGAAPVHAGCDGEPVELSPPLEFEIVPEALRIRVPSGTSPTG